MTTYSKATLKTFFEQNDIPTGTDYANLIDSQVNIVETSVQSMGGPLFTPELITSRVSGSNFSFGGNSLGAIIGANINFGAGGNFSVSASSIFASASNNINFYANTNVSFNVNDSGSFLSIANNINIGASNGNILINTPNFFTVSAGIEIEFDSPKVYSPTGFFGLAGVTSAAGSAQATAAPLINITTQAKGVVDGQTTGFLLSSNKAGLTQYIFNDAVSANLWPCTGGKINALANNAAFSMAASTLYTISHIAASAYAVK